MKNKIIKNLVVFCVVYTIIYLLGSYANWEFINPFEWITDIPKDNGLARLVKLYFLLVLIWVTYLLETCISVNKKKEED